MTIGASPEPRSVEPAPAALAEVISRFGVMMTFGRNAEIYAQEAPAEHLFRVVSGVVRTASCDLDGRRHIGEFYYPGDLFGLEAAARHQYSAEAITACQVQMVRQSAVRTLIGVEELDLAILGGLRRELQKAREHMRLLGLRNAREKVGAFLAALAGPGVAGGADLPMGRQDMADYLGLTIETVSRMLSQLQSEDVIEFASSRRVLIRRPEMLEAFAA
ncbi:MAG: helix-turn-helix domain-containing protein [Proteobacteria bacterium]|nr:helix-turn-helix domain-containing protein [Pseudomonadota bacterium]